MAPEDVPADITVTREGLLLGANQIGPRALEDLAEAARDAFGTRGLPRSVALALDERQFLRRKLADHRIPLVRAQQMAELDVETQTPFKLSDVYILFADRPLSERASHYYLVRRDLLDPVLDALRRNRRKLGSLIFDAGGHRERASDFAIAGLRGRQGTFLDDARQHAFSLACAALVAFAGYNVSTALANALTSVDEEIASVEPKAKAARLAFRKQADYLDRIQAVHAEQRAYFPVVRILEELSFILPDTTYLTSFSVRQSQVKITGFSSDAAALIPLVDSSKVFANPRFVSAVVRTPDRKGEQFDLELEVEHAR